MSARPRCPHGDPVIGVADLRDALDRAVDTEGVDDPPPVLIASGDGLLPIDREPEDRS